MNLSVIGGDLRIVKLIEMLCNDGYTVYTYGIEKAENLNQVKNVIKCSTLEDAINASTVIIGSIPLSSNKQEINTPFSNETISIQNLFSKLSRKHFITGSVSEDLIKLAKKNNFEITDIMKREELSILNTISTAEGAIQIAMQETLSTVHSSNVLIMGFGRIGKILAKMLNGIGANVFCEARKDPDIAWIKAYGYTPIHLNDLDSYLSKFDIIFNTIPSIILDKDKLSKLKKDALVIDLASAPGGVDRESANNLGVKTIWALALPGKVAPLTSAEFLKKTIYNVLKEKIS